MPVPEKLKSVANNPAVQKAAAAFILAVLAALGISLGSGCAALAGGPEAQRARVDKFKCQVAALAPLTDPVLDTEQLMLDLYAGKASLGAVLQNLDAKPAEVKALIERLNACEPDEPAPEPDAGVAS